jgi:hypothetical protein
MPTTVTIQSIELPNSNNNGQSGTARVRIVSDHAELITIDIQVTVPIVDVMGNDDSNRAAAEQVLGSIGKLADAIKAGTVI